MSFNTVSVDTFQKNDNKEQMKKAFDNTPSIDLSNNFELPKANHKDKKQTFSFTMLPNSKKKLDKLAKDQGFKSTSLFLEELINSL
ncbi:hypothetical protein [Weissella kandleri]|uniref:hypothetical protein n=1 Tax=Weissella kandleri TaxID=1616 RepID=UPI00070E0DB9|nr:hypothetical protein [Weissella kandleri]